MDLTDIVSMYASVDEARKNMEMRRFAKEVLLEENYEKFIKSYKFTFWFQLIGVMSGFLLPSVLLLILTHNLSYLAFGAAFGILWMCFWLPISLLMPQTRINRKFSKWFRKRHSTLDELDEIFYSAKRTRL